MSTLQFIDQQRSFHPVQQLCQVLGAVPSRYYAWRHRQTAGAGGTTEPAWEMEMVAVFDHHKRRYGTRRRRVELQEIGHRVGRQDLRTGLRRHGRKALQPKSFVPRTTDSTHGQHCAPNLLLDQTRPTQANRLWVSGPHVPAAGQRGLGLSVRLSRRMHQAHGGLAGAG
jgi:putative transposase